VSHPRTLELLQEGIAAAKAGEKERARPLLRAAAALDEGNELTWLWLAGAAETPAEALSCLERVLALNPTHERARAAVGPARVQAGVEAAKAGDKSRARLLLRQATEQDPGNETGWLWLASVAEAPAEAIGCLERVLQINPENERARGGLERYQTLLASSNGASSSPPNGSAAAELVAPSRRPPRLRTVLVVEESPALHELATETLEREGCRVFAANDGYEAIDVLRDKGAPDLIFLAVALPGIDGYQMCKLLRENPDTAGLPIVLLTNKDGFFSKMRARMCGATDCLPRPFETDDLVQALEKHCPAHDPAPAGSEA
jgi:twitching motility two-component system response regulator PilG